MAKHKDFEELCALAPLGGLPPAQLRELDAHLLEVDLCGQAVVDYDRLYRRVVPAVKQHEDEYIESRRADIRASVLRDIAAIGLPPVAIEGKTRAWSSSPSGVSCRGYMIR